MNTALFMQYGVPALIAVISAVAGHWYGKKSASTSTAAPSTPASPVPVASHLWNDPIVQAFLSKLIAAAHASGHAALDAAIVKVFPPAAPAVPVINSVVDAVEAKVVPPAQS